MTAAMSAWTRSSTPAALGRLERLDRGGRDALHEDAAQQLQPGGVARLRADDLDRHPERPEELGEALGARSGRERGCREPRARDDADQRDVRELHRQRRRELALELSARRCSGRRRARRRRARRRRRPPPSSATAAALMLRTTSAPLTASRSLAAFAIPVEPPGGIPAAHRAARRHEIGGDPAAGLAEAEHRDLHQSSPRRSRGARSGRRRARRPRSAAASRARARRARARAAAPRRRARSGAPSPRRSPSRRGRPAGSRRRRRRPARRASPPRPSSHPARARTAPRSAGRSRRARRGRARRRRRGSPRRRCACACVTSSSPTSATGAGSALVSTSTSPGLGVRDGRVHHRVVARRADGDPRRACDAGAGHDLGQRQVDDARCGRRPRGSSRRRAARGSA